MFEKSMRGEEEQKLLVIDGRGKIFGLVN